MGWEGKQGLAQLHSLLLALRQYYDTRRTCYLTLEWSCNSSSQSRDTPREIYAPTCLTYVNIYIYIYIYMNLKIVNLEMEVGIKR